MSTTVDSKVVEMKFDNKNFENNVQTSLSTLDKLKKSLNLNGAAKGLENVNSAAKSFNMSGLTSAVETVRTRFSALEVMAVTALANIANSAVNAGKRMIAALTIDPIKTGFQEYETQINAVQTILANTSSKGTTLNQVNSALDELNTYADKTIYNFTEMTRNIGTFTAAGVDLKTSVDAIKGIANLAAVSGSTSQQASTAMYQLSQALASGTVKLMDWNSVVNAGMGGQVFQDSLKETARLHGIAIDDMITEQGSFRETLQEGWLSAEILTETLSKFTGDLSESQLKQMGYTEEQIKEIIELGQMANDAATKVKTFTQLWDTLKESAQSGWSQTWKIIVGDFEEAKELFTGISTVLGEIIGNSSETRNKLLLGALGTGWDQLLAEGIKDEEGFKESINKTMEARGKSLNQMITEQKELAKANGESISDEKAFQNVLKSGAVTSDILSASLTNLADKTRGLSDEQLEELGYTRDQVDALEKLETSVKNGEVSLGKFADMMTQVSGREKLISSLYRVFEGIMNIAGSVKQAFTDVFPPITVENLSSFIDGFSRITSEFKTFTSTYGPKITSIFRGLFAVLSIVKEAFSAIFNAIRPLLGKFGDLGTGVLDSAASFGEWLFSISEMIKRTDYFGGLIQKVINFVKNAAIAVKDFYNGISTKVKGTWFDDILSNAKQFFSTFKEKVQLPALEAIQSVLERIRSRFIQVRDAVSDMKIGVFSAFAAMGASLANSKLFTGLQKLWGGIKTVALGITNVLGDLLGGLLEKLGNADFEGVFDLVNGGILAAIGIGISNFINKLTSVVKDGQGFIGGLKDIKDAVLDTFGAFQNSLKAETLKKIAIAIAILTASLLVLSLIDSEKLSTALGAITALFAELMGSMAVFDKIAGKGTKGLTGIVASMIGVSVAVLLLAGALKMISNLNFEELMIGIVGIAALAGIMVGTSKILSSGSGKITKGAAQMILFAAAVKILASVCKDLSVLKWEELVKGLAGIGILFAEMAGFSKLMGDGNKMISTGIGMIAVAAAVKILVSAVRGFATMEWSAIGKGLAAVGGALLVVGFAVDGMPKNMIGIGLGLIAVSAALLIMSTVLSNFGGMEWSAIGKGLAAIGGSLLILAVGLNAMKGTLGGSAAMAIAVIALAALVPIMIALGAMSWESIAKGLVAMAGAFAIMGLAGLVLGPLVPVILGLTGAFALFGAGILAIGAGLALAGLGLTALAIGIGAIATAGAAGATALVAALTVVVTGVANMIPLVIRKIGEGIIEFCNVISGSAEAIGAAVKSIVLSLVSTLSECVPALAEGALVLISGVLSSLIEHGPEIIDQLFTFLLMVFDGLIEYAPALVDKLVSFIIALINGLSARISELLAVAVVFLSSLMQGIADIIGPLIESVLGPLIQIVTDSIGTLIEALSPIMPEITAMVEAVVSAIQSICEAFILLVSQISPIIDSVTSLIQQLGDSISQIFESIASVITTCGDTISTVLSAVGDTITSVFNGIGTVIESVGTSIKSVLDGIAGIIESVGTAALNAGTGFNNLATGVKTITELNLIDMAASMGAVAVAIAGITAHSSGLASAGTGMQQIAAGATMSATSFTSMAMQLSLIVSKISLIGITTRSAMAQMVAAIASTNGCFVTLTTAASIAVLTMVTIFTNGIGPIALAATTMLTSFINAANAQRANLITTFTNLMTTIITTIKSKYYEFYSTGAMIITKLIAGVRTKDIALSNAFTTSLGGALTAIRNKYWDFYSAGSYLVEGFANGITANTFRAEAAAAAMAEAALNAAKRKLNEHSPSKESYKIGNFFGAGFVNAILDYVNKAYYAGSTMAESAKMGLGNAISKITDIITNGIDTQPTIRPVLDLSNVEAGTSRLNTLFSRNQAMSISAGMSRIESDEENQNGDPPPSAAVNTYSFTQNNYSPKPLSRLEIYRQTKNQFSAMKGLVNP